MVGGCGLDASGSGYRPMMNPCEHGNETMGSTKGTELLVGWTLHLSIGDWCLVSGSY